MCCVLVWLAGLEGAAGTRLAVCRICFSCLLWLASVSFWSWIIELCVDGQLNVLLISEIVLCV